VLKTRDSFCNAKVNLKLKYFCKMMMIAFIIIKSGLVPLIEVYALKSVILDFRLSVVCVHTICFSLSERKIC